MSSFRRACVVELVGIDLWLHLQIQPQVSRPGHSLASLPTRMVTPRGSQTGYSLRYQLSTGNPRLAGNVLGHTGPLTPGHSADFSALHRQLSTAILRAQLPLSAFQFRFSVFVWQTR
jgi:hypothetical protein